MLAQVINLWNLSVLMGKLLDIRMSTLCPNLVGYLLGCIERLHLLVMGCSIYIKSGSRRYMYMNRLIHVPVHVHAHVSFQRISTLAIPT